MPTDPLDAEAHVSHLEAITDKLTEILSELQGLRRDIDDLAQKIGKDR